MDKNIIIIILIIVIFILASILVYNFWWPESSNNSINTNVIDAATDYPEISLYNKVCALEVLETLYYDDLELFPFDHDITPEGIVPKGGTYFKESDNFNETKYPEIKDCFSHKSKPAQIGL
ncbi:hypothetical protein ACFL04_04175 [Patescibacteria group bacterium]